MSDNQSVVTTKNGKVEGFTLNGLHVFKGIPYAAPPVGELRWRPPQPVRSWPGVRPADRFEHQCLQARPFGDMMFRNAGGSEDCLYLNVWTPACDDAQRPVMVWIHGGASGSGSGGPSVNMLAPAMKIAVARLELAMGARLQVSSGYRTTRYQAELCQRVTGPCAPPGRSMHQSGLAVDAANWRQTLPHLAAASLCQPLPANDAVHLSHTTGREC